MQRYVASDSLDKVVFIYISPTTKCILSLLQWHLLVLDLESVVVTYINPAEYL